MMMLSLATTMPIRTMMIAMMILMLPTMADVDVAGDGNDNVDGDGNNLAADDSDEEHDDVRRGAAEDDDLHGCEEDDDLGVGFMR